MTSTKKTSVAQRIAALPREEDLGTYIARSQYLKAVLQLRAKIEFGGMSDHTGSDRYQVELRLFTCVKRFGEDVECGKSVTAAYDAFNLAGIFPPLKKAEEGFEELLKREHLNTNWREEREVMRCILSLEDQTRHLFDARDLAKRDRYRLVHGDETPWYRD